MMHKYFTISEAGYGTGATDQESVDNYFMAPDSGKVRAYVYKAPATATGFSVINGTLRWVISGKNRPAKSSEIIARV